LSKSRLKFWVKSLDKNKKRKKVEAEEGKERRD